MSDLNFEEIDPLTGLPRAQDPLNVGAVTEESIPSDESLSLDQGSFGEDEITNQDPPPRVNAEAVKPAETEGPSLWDRFTLNTDEAQKSLDTMDSTIAGWGKKVKDLTGFDGLENFDGDTGIASKAFRSVIYSGNAMGNALERGLYSAASFFGADVPKDSSGAVRASFFDQEAYGFYNLTGEIGAFALESAVGTKLFTGAARGLSYLGKAIETSHGLRTVGRTLQAGTILEERVRNIDALAKLGKATRSQKALSFAAKYAVGQASTDFLFQDPRGGRLSDLMKAWAGQEGEDSLAAFMAEPLSTQSGDSEVTARFKNMLEGLVLEGPMTVIFSGVGTVGKFAGSKLRGGFGITDGVFKAVDAERATKRLMEQLGTAAEGKERDGILELLKQKLSEGTNLETARAMRFGDFEPTVRPLLDEANADVSTMFANTKLRVKEAGGEPVFFDGVGTMQAAKPSDGIFVPISEITVNDRRFNGETNSWEHGAFVEGSDNLAPKMASNLVFQTPANAKHQINDFFYGKHNTDRDVMQYGVMRGFNDPVAALWTSLQQTTEVDKHNAVLHFYKSGQRMDVKVGDLLSNPRQFKKLGLINQKQIDALIENEITTNRFRLLPTDIFSHAAVEIDPNLDLILRALDEHEARVGEVRDAEASIKQDEAVSRFDAAAGELAPKGPESPPKGPELNDKGPDSIQALEGQIASNEKPSRELLSLYWRTRNLNVDTLKPEVILQAQAKVVEFNQVKDVNLVTAQNIEAELLKAFGGDPNLVAKIGGSRSVKAGDAAKIISSVVNEKFLTPFKFLFKDELTNGELGLTNFNNKIIEIAKKGVEGGVFSRTMIHEIYHAALNTIEMTPKIKGALEAAQKVFNTERASFIASNPFMKVLLNDATAKDVIEGRAATDRLAAVQLELDKAVLKGTMTEKQAKALYKKAYRFTDFDEYMAESLTDKALDHVLNQAGKVDPALGLFNKIRFAVNRGVDAILETLGKFFGKDPVQRLFNAIQNGEAKAQFDSDLPGSIRMLVGDSSKPQTSATMLNLDAPKELVKDGKTLPQELEALLKSKRAAVNVDKVRFGQAAAEQAARVAEDPKTKDIPEKPSILSQADLEKHGVEKSDLNLKGMDGPEGLAVVMRGAESSQIERGLNDLHVTVETMTKEGKDTTTRIYANERELYEQDLSSVGASLGLDPKKVQERIYLEMKMTQGDVEKLSPEKQAELLRTLRSVMLARRTIFTKAGLNALDLFNKMKADGKWNGKDFSKMESSEAKALVNAFDALIYAQNSYKMVSSETGRSLRALGAKFNGDIEGVSPSRAAQRTVQETAEIDTAAFDKFKNVLGSEALNKLTNPQQVQNYVLLMQSLVQQLEIAGPTRFGLISNSPTGWSFPTYIAANLMNAPITMMRNLFGNTFNLLYIVTRGVAGGLGEVVTIARAGQGAESLKYWGRFVKNSVSSFKEALPIAWDGFKNRKTYFASNGDMGNPMGNIYTPGMDDSKGLFSLVGKLMHPVGIMANSTIGFGLRASASVDEMFKQMIYRSSVKSQIMDRLEKQGLRGADLVEKAELSYTQLFKERNQFNIDTLWNRAADTTFELHAQGKIKADDFASVQLDEFKKLYKTVEDTYGGGDTHSVEDFVNISRGARQEAEVATFTNSKSTVTNRVAGFVNQLKYNQTVNPLVRVATSLLFPFVSTPLNILEQGLRQSLAPLEIGWKWGASNLKKEGRGAINAAIEDLQAGLSSSNVAIRANAVGRLHTSVAVYASVYALIENESITGGGPRRKDERDVWTAAGNQPYSVKIGGKWVSYQFAEPIATMFGLVADVVLANKYSPEDLADREEPLQKYGIAFITALANQLKSKTMLTSMNRFMAVVGDPESKATTQFMKGINREITPLASAFENYRVAADPIQRDLTEMSVAMTPWFFNPTGKSDKRYNLLGKEVRHDPSGGDGSKDGDIWEAASKFATATAPIKGQTMNKVVADELTKIRYSKNLPSSKMGDIDLRMVGPQGNSVFSQWMKAVGEVTIHGKNLEQYLEKTIKSNHYQRLAGTPDLTSGTDSPRSKQIDAVITMFREKAKAQVMKTNPELRQYQRQFNNLNFKLARAKSGEAQDIYEKLVGLQRGVER